MMHKIRIWCMACLALVAVIVIFQNTQTVETRFLFISIRMPNAALIAITLLVGYVIGVLTALGFPIRKRRRGGQGQ